MRKICVIGSMNLDIVIKIHKIPNEGENIYCESVNHYCGGKGQNQAIALSKLGAEPLFYGCVGKDLYGETLVDNLRGFGVDTSHIIHKDKDTGKAFILLEANGDNRIIVEPGANEAISAVDIRRDVTAMIEQSDLVLIQLEISLEAISEIAAICRRRKKRLVIDAGPIRGCKMDRLSGAFCISPNQTELGALIGKPLNTEADLLNGARKLAASGAEHVLVKLGSKGCLYVNAHEAKHFDAYPVKTVDTTGAGDSFMAGFCAGLMDGMNMEGAIDFASKCGAAAVTRMGAVRSMPSRDDLAQFDSRFPILI